MREQGRYSSAKSYQDALNSFLRFCGQEMILYTRIDREMLLRYQDYLRDRECSWNTVSTYMRRIRRVYGLAMENGEAPFSRYLFKGIFLGVKSKQKKALPAESLRLLMTAPLAAPELRKTQRALCLMFLFCGMAFVDFAHLKKSDIRNVLRYNRVKTKTPISVEVLDTAKEMIHRLRNSQPSRPDCPDYLFDILSGDKKRKDEGAYREYQSALRRFNNCLKDLARALRLNSPVTSYTLRHSWATTAKYRGVPIEMISESLGHKSIKTTQIYLKGFELKERTEVNKGNLSYIKNCYVGK